MSHGGCGRLGGTILRANAKVATSWLRLRTQGALACILAGAVSLTSTAGVNTFTRTGSIPGLVYDVAFQPGSSSVAYAIATSGFYRSTDGGISWQLVHDDLPGGLRHLATHADVPSHVMLFISSFGVIGTSNAGVSLDLPNTFRAPTSAMGKQLEYSADGSVLYASADNIVYRSYDNGASWTAGNPIAPMHIDSLAIDSTDPNILYTAGGPDEGYRSPDGGVTWASWTLPQGALKYDITIASRPARRIWLATESGTYFTDDVGLNPIWTRANDRSTRVLVVDPQEPDRVYSGGVDVLRVSTDASGTNWSELEGSQRVGQIWSLAIDPNDSDSLLLSGQAGIARSTNGGISWMRSDEGINAGSIESLIASPESARVYIGTLSSGVQVIDGAGDVVDLNTESRRALDGPMSELAARALFVQPGSPDGLVHGTTLGTFRSSDGGASWEYSANGAFQNLRKIVSTSADGQTLLAIAGTRLYRSVGDSFSWTELPGIGLPYNLYYIESAPADRAVVYLAAAPNSTSEYTLFKSVDGGDSWTPIDYELPEHTYGLAVDPTNAQVVYVVTRDDVRKTTNGGQSWTVIASDVDTHLTGILGIDPVHASTIYVSGSSQIARSVDGGRTWQNLTPQHHVRWHTTAALVDPTRPERVLIGSGGSGVYEISIQPDLSIMALEYPVTIKAGSPATYRYRMQNLGPFDATHVRATISLAPGSTNVTARTSDGTCTVSGTTAICQAPVLRVSEAFEITVESAAAQAGNANATVQGDQPDPVSTNNSLSSAVGVGQSDLSIAIEGPTGGPHQLIGDIRYDVTITNGGPSTATDIQVGLTVSDRASVISASAATGTCTEAIACTIPTLAANETATVSFDVMVGVGETVLTASASASESDPNSENNSASMTTIISPPASITPPPSASDSDGGGGSSSAWMLLSLAALLRMRRMVDVYSLRSR